MRLAFFEDEGAKNFSPIALLRPVFELRCGHFSIQERVISAAQPETWGAFLRSYLAEIYSEAHPAVHVNDLDWLRSATTLCLNGRWLAPPELSHSSFAEVETGTAGWLGDELAYIALTPQLALLDPQLDFAAELLRVAKTLKPVQVSGQMLRYPWDLLPANIEWLAIDFAHRSRPSATSALDSRVAIVGPTDALFVHETAQLDPYVVIDTTQGPVWIEAGARVQAFTRLEGPCYIGRSTQLFRANIREGCSIGPVCRVGGEVEESIMHGFANKYHDGFLGHSYVCPWVNLGALSTNSDLKNDYSSVRVPVQGESIDTGSTKVGCFIGDHTKTALCSLFNTGSSIGVMNLVLPGGGLLPKHLPSFCRFWNGALEELPDGTASGLASARVAVGRRDEELTPAMENAIRFLYDQTQGERQAAIARWQDRQRR